MYLGIHARELATPDGAYATPLTGILIADRASSRPYCSGMTVEMLDRYLRDLATADAFSGVLRVTAGADERFAGAYGLASRAWGEPNTLDTRFDTASSTKLFTAVATLQQVDAGVFSLNTSAIGYLGLEGTAISPDVTVRHLLTHTSGIGDDADEEAGESYEAVWHARPSYTVLEAADFLPQFVHRPPNFAPGAGCRYNNCGYVLLGLMVERATGRPYRDVVRDDVFARAGMADSDFLRMDRVNERLAEGADPIRDEAGTIVGWKRNIYSYPPIGSPDAGAHVTAADLDRFIRAVLEGRLLSAELTAAFLAPQVVWRVRDRWVQHFGYGPWFRVDHGGTLAPLAPATLAALDAALPRNWPRANPIDIAGDASAERYARTLDVVLAAPEIDATLVINCPNAIVDAQAAADATIATAKRHRMPVLTSWVGDGVQAEARRRFVAAGLPTFDTPTEAVRGFMHLVRHRRNREALMQVPAAAIAEISVDHARVDAILVAARAAGRGWLMAHEALALIGAYGIPEVLDSLRKKRHIQIQTEVGRVVPRFVEVLHGNEREISVDSFRTMLSDMTERLDATSGHIEMSFPYFVMKKAPVTGVESVVKYDASLTGEIHGGREEMWIRVVVAATSLCPCSKRISDYGAHNQRSHITIKARVREHMWIEELIDIAEQEASCEVFGILKRPDEKWVTERAYDNPKFVEDIVRDVAVRLNNEDRVLAYVVEAENFESIHNHSAYALIEKDKQAADPA